MSGLIYRNPKNSWQRQKNCIRKADLKNSESIIGIYFQEFHFYHEGSFCYCEGEGEFNKGRKQHGIKMIWV